MVFVALDYIEEYNQRLLSLIQTGAATQFQNGYQRVVTPPRGSQLLPMPQLPFHQRLYPLDFPRNAAGDVIGFVSTGNNYYSLIIFQIFCTAYIHSYICIYYIIFFIYIYIIII